MHFESETKQGRDPVPDTAFKNVLAFHKLTRQVTFGSTNYSPRRFEQLLSNLLKFGFEFVPLANSVREPKSNQVAITFDDGYAHLLETLPPFIVKYRIKPTVMVPTAYIGRKNSWDYSSRIKAERHLSDSEIRELSEIGVEFGSHGHLHRDFRRCQSPTLSAELIKSKQILEDITGKEVKSLSYPFGRTSARVCDMVQKASFESAFTMNFPEMADTNMSLGRIPVYFFDNAGSTRQKLYPNGIRSVHKVIGKAVNFLSFGTILLNMITGQSGGIERSGS